MRDHQFRKLRVERDPIHLERNRVHRAHPRHRNHLRGIDCSQSHPRYVGRVRNALRPRSAYARARDHRRARDRLRRVPRVRRRESHAGDGGLMILQKNVAMTRAAGTSREKPGRAGTPALTARRALTLLIPVLLVLATWPYPASAATEYVWTTTADFDSGSSVRSEERR